MCNNNVLLKPCRSCSYNCCKAGRRGKPESMSEIDWQRQKEDIKKCCPYERKK